MISGPHNRLMHRYGRDSFIMALVEIMREHNVSFGTIEHDDEDWDEIVFVGPVTEKTATWIATLNEIIDEVTEE